MGLVAFGSTALLSGSGILAGFFIGKQTISEVNNGRQWLLFLQELLIGALVFVALLHLGLVWAIVGGVLASVTLTMISFLAVPKFIRPVASLIKNCRTMYGMYALLAIDFFVGQRIGMAQLIPSLIFVYGIPTGSLIVAKKGAVRHAGVAVMIFVLTAVLLYLLL